MRRVGALVAVLSCIPGVAAAQEGPTAGPAGAPESSAPSEAPSSPGNDARQRFTRGQTAYQQGDYETSIAEWNAAFALDPRPRIQFNLSQAYERLGRLSEAAAALDRYLETADPQDAFQGDARARRAALRERLARTGIRIVGAPDGATIAVDGEDWGRTPRPDPIAVEPGPHRVVLRLPGRQDFQATVVVPAGQTVQVDAAMDAAAAAPLADASTAEGGGSAWPWVLMGAGGAFALVATVIGLAAVGQADDATFSEDDKADDARSLAGVADALGLISLASIGTGFVWWLLEDDGGEEAQAGVRLELGPTFGRQHAGAKARLIF